MRPKFERIKPHRIEHSRGEGDLRHLRDYNTTRGVPQIYPADDYGPPRPKPSPRPPGRKKEKAEERREGE